MFHCVLVQNMLRARKTKQKFENKRRNEHKTKTIAFLWHWIHTRSTGFPSQAAKMLLSLLWTPGAFLSCVIATYSMSSNLHCWLLEQESPPKPCIFRGGTFGN